MRFALLGEHPDGVDLASALVDTGAHALVVTTGVLSPEIAARLGNPARVGDVEEILADPAVEAVIVAAAPGVRPALLRRSLQSERHVICVHPADEKPDVAYEAAMMQQDTGFVLFPLLPEALHPGVVRLADFLARHDAGPIGPFRLLTYDRHATGEVLDSIHEEGVGPAFPGWDILRRLGGELAEVSSFADGEEPAARMPVLLAGRFEAGGLFQATLVPGQPASYWRLVVIGTRGQVTLTWPQGWNGPAFLNWREGGRDHEEYFERFDPWPTVVEAFERAIAKQPTALRWQDEVRALELDAAARRSVERRRVDLMDYQEASEEVGFKGTMTLLGCGLLWATIVMLVLSRWYPWTGWLMLPLLLGFVLLQLLRNVIPKKPSDGDSP
jgi:predicted dehydrogenase